jgi:negative regulator of sigma E activity
MKKGDRSTFLTSCGQEITGIVVEVHNTGYVVKGDEIQSNQYEDGLFRFTFG